MDRSISKLLSGALFFSAVVISGGATLFHARAGQPQGMPAAHARQTDVGIQYTGEGQYLLPPEYREWTFLSSGMDMSYEAAPASVTHHSFNNVFASPTSYQAFKETGTWPDKTVLVLEIREAQTQPSLNKHGQTQGRNVTGLEVHLKDDARFKGGWAFFEVGEDGRGRYFEPTANCYSCHQKHAAVDTTFVQFYPTLLPSAEAHKTFSAGYLHDREKVADAGKRRP